MHLLRFAHLGHPFSIFPRPESKSSTKQFNHGALVFFTSDPQAARHLCGSLPSLTNCEHNKSILLCLLLLSLQVGSAYGGRNEKMFDCLVFNNRF
jgi:hypothetical protein